MCTNEYNKVDLNKFDNQWYKPGIRFKIAFWILIKTVFIDTNIPYPSKLKVFILRIFGARIGKNVVIKQKVNIKYPWFLVIGNNSWIGEKVWIDNLAEVIIGENVCLSQGAYLLTGNHDFRAKTFDLIVKKITLEDGVWIGAKSVVCPGVVCKSHSVLAVNSVATQDLERYSIYQGNPATVKRKRVVK